MQRFLRVSKSRVNRLQHSIVIAETTILRDKVIQVTLDRAAVTDIAAAMVKVAIPITETGMVKAATVLPAVNCRDNPAADISPAKICKMFLLMHKMVRAAEIVLAEMVKEIKAVTTKINAVKMAAIIRTVALNRANSRIRFVRMFPA